MNWKNGPRLEFSKKKKATIGMIMLRYNYTEFVNGLRYLVKSLMASVISSEVGSTKIKVVKFAAEHSKDQLASTFTYMRFHLARPQELFLYHVFKSAEEDWVSSSESVVTHTYSKEMLLDVKLGDVEMMLKVCIRGVFYFSRPPEWWRNKVASWNLVVSVAVQIANATMTITNKGEVILLKIEVATKYLIFFLP